MLTLYDIHSHILPGIDDGCKTPEEAVLALQMAYRQGVRFLFATPHYYPVESVDCFLRRRQEAWQQLSSDIGRENITDIPHIQLGAEVAYRPGISNEPRLQELCLGKSKHLLLELPFRPWGNDELRQVRNMVCTLGITPILAHYERYRQIQTKTMFETMRQQNVQVQMNGEYLLDFLTRRRARKWIAAGMVHHLGSDCHNLRERKPNLAEAAAYLQKHKQQSSLFRLAENARQIFEADKMDRGIL